MMLARTSKNISLKPLSLSILIGIITSLSQPVVADTVYGPVKSTDTLSKIVRNLYTGPKTSYQTLMKQIVENNPRAFQNGDMNHLKLNASLELPGNLWKNSLRSTSLNSRPTTKPAEKLITTDAVDRSAPALTVEQMKGRIVFLDAERSSLIIQVAELKRETVRLEEKVQKLEANSRKSDEQLRILDAEIIRLTNLLSNKDKDVRVSKADLNQLVVLQEKLRLVQKENAELNNELSSTKKKLGSNNNYNERTNQKIAQLTQENNKLQKLLQDAQPGVHYYQDSTNGYKLSLLAGRLQLPIGLLVVGGALLGLMLIALVATRRKPKQAKVITQPEGLDPFSETQNFSELLETDNHEPRGFSQTHTQPEENVFKMFDEGTLEMDLKLDMAEAYLQVSDFASARSILQEVIKNGSELQKRKATRLIDKAA